MKTAKPLAMRHRGRCTSTTALLIVLASVPGAGQTTESYSPALPSTSLTHVARLEQCLGNGWFNSAEKSAAEQVTAWFEAFRAPHYSSVVSDVLSAPSNGVGPAIRNAKRRIEEVRRLADYRTEQPLIALVEAALREHKGKTGCRNLGAQIVFLMANQRDRAWSWAGAMEDLFLAQQAEVAKIKRRSKTKERAVERGFASIREFRGRLESFRTR